MEIELSSKNSAIISRNQYSIIVKNYVDGVRDILSTSHKYKNVEIIAWALCIDYIHLNIVILPKFSKLRFMVHLLENSLMIYDIQPELQRG